METASSKIRCVQASVRRSALAGIIALLLATNVPAQQARLLHGWETEPNLGASWIQDVQQPEIKIDTADFTSPEREVRLAAAQKVILAAKRGQPIADRDANLQSLLEKLKQADEYPQIQLSLASAAIQLADASHAALLWDLLNESVATRRLIEAALIHWKSPIALDQWRGRLQEDNTIATDLILAIDGLAQVGSEADIPALERLLRSDRTSTSMKVLVARAMGSLSKQGLENLSEQITAAAIEQHQLMAAELLVHHSSDRARQLLMMTIQSKYDAARQVAYAALSENFGAAAHEIALEMIAQPNSNLRLKAQAVFHRFDDVESLRRQARLIEDPNHTIRNQARANLEQKSGNAKLKPVVDEVIAFELKNNKPPAIIQSILLSVALKQRERSAQIIPLLDHPDTDTSMTAAWGLQSLVDSPELLDLILTRTVRMTERLSKQEVVTETEILQHAYLIEALGRNRYQPALGTLMAYIPKNGHKLGDVARASAIWSIGKIMAGSQDPAVAKQMAGRMLDQSADDPEDPAVQFTAALALGFIQAPESANELRKIFVAPPAPLALARDWALEAVRSKE